MASREYGTPNRKTSSAANNQKKLFLSTICLSNFYRATTSGLQGKKGLGGSVLLIGIPFRACPHKSECAKRPPVRRM
jgi:hypothetical protein